MSNHNYPIKPSLINAWSARFAEQVPFCPCPPETSDNTAKASVEVVLDEVDGGIFSIVQRLKQIKEEINQLNGSAFEKSLLSDAQHYQLLDVEMFLSDFVSRAAGGVEQ